MISFLRRFLWRSYQFGDILVHINHKNKFIYIHIPKNAGSSLSKALNFSHITHATIRQVQKVVDHYEFDHYFKFCFVRHPYDRFLSLYNYARMPESMYHSAIAPEKARCGKHFDYELLKDASLEDCANYLVEGKLKHDDSWFHWQPQYEWLINDKGVIAVDFIGRFERLNEDFNELKARLHINTSLQHINLSSTIDDSYEQYYNSATKRIIYDYYKRDFELFNYQP